MADTHQPSKEYRARILVRLSDDFLPQPVLTKDEVEAHLREALNLDDPESPIIAVLVDDPRAPKRRY